MDKLSYEQILEINKKKEAAIKRLEQKRAVQKNNCTFFNNKNSPPNKKRFFSNPDIFDKSNLTTVLDCSLLEDGSKIRFIVNCGYNKDLINIFKTILGKRYIPETKTWSFPMSSYNQLNERIKKFKFSLGKFDIQNSNGKFTAQQIDVKEVTHIDKKILQAKCCLVPNLRFEIQMPYHSGSIELFKSFKSKGYNAVNKTWNFHLSEYNHIVDSFKSKVKDVLLEKLPEVVTKTFRHVITNQKLLSEAEVDFTSKVGNKLADSLFPFQRKGVNFAIQNKGRVLLADDMGLGKTVQSICIAAYYRSKWPLLVVCPSSVQLMWKESFLKWLPSILKDDDIFLVTSGKKTSILKHSITIVSYNLLGKMKELFVAKKFQVAIIDESHFIKNMKASRTKAAMQVLKSCEHLLLLSGTPALSRPIELFPQLSILRPDLFSKFIEFGQRYCGPKKTPWCTDYSGSSNSTELGILLQNGGVMLRRTKECVLSELPPKIRRTVLVDVGTVFKQLNKQQKDNLHEIKNEINKTGLTGVEKHGRLLQFFAETAQVKSHAVVAYITDLLENNEKFVVFAHHQSMMNSIETQLVKKSVGYIRIDGKTSSDKRQQNVDVFQEDADCKVALLSITAANMGITLNSACLVVFAELFWNPGILIQAEDRCYRIGQKSVVNVHYLIAKGTSDDHVWQLVKRKLNMLEKAGLADNDFNKTEHDEDTSYKGAKDLSNTQQKSILNFFKRDETKNDKNSQQSNLDIKPPFSNEKIKSETFFDESDDDFRVKKDKKEQNSCAQSDSWLDDDYFDEDLLVQVADDAEQDQIHAKT